MPILIYGLDTITIRHPELHGVDAYFIRFLRRVIGIKASYYSHITNDTVWQQAGKPTKPSETLLSLQQNNFVEIFTTPIEEPYHNVVFATAFKDRILVKGRRRGMQIPYWAEILSKRHSPKLWNSGHNAKNPHEKYLFIARRVRESSFGKAPKRAQSSRARHP